MWSTNADQSRPNRTPFAHRCNAYISYIIVGLLTDSGTRADWEDKNYSGCQSSQHDSSNEHTSCVDNAFYIPVHQWPIPLLRNAITIEKLLRTQRSILQPQGKTFKMLTVKKLRSVKKRTINFLMTQIRQKKPIVLYFTR